MISIENKNNIEVVEVAIGKKTYKIPLAKYLPYKAIKQLRNNNKDLDAIIDILSNYIPMEVLEELTMMQITQILEAWGDASKDDDDDENLGK